MRRAWNVAALVATLALVASSPALAARKPRDEVWTRPDYATRRVDRIALIPVVSYDNNLENETLVEGTLSAALKGSAYHWTSATVTRELLRAQAPADRLLKDVRAGVLANARIDSLSAPRIAGVLGCDAMLTLRVDQWDQQTPDWNQPGKPYTRVQLHAALVDSLGRLLWTANGTQTGEGAYYDPSQSPVSVNDTGLDRKPVTGQAGAPSFREVLSLLFARWATQFPAPPKAAAHAAAPPDTAFTPPIVAPADTTSYTR